MIPDKFTIFAQTIDVVIDNEYCHKEKLYGVFLPYENKIILADKYKVKNKWVPYKQDIVESTYNHELSHCILYHTGYENIWLDEILVGIMGNIIHQIDLTKEKNV